jgi:hypothetical protein
MNRYGIGVKVDVSIDRGLYDLSKVYRDLIKELVDNPFVSQETDILSRIASVEDFWTKGKVSKFYNFSDFVMEMKDAGAVTSQKLRSCVLSGVRDDSLFGARLESQAEYLDTVMRNVEGLKAYAVQAGEVYFGIDPGYTTMLIDWIPSKASGLSVRLVRVAGNREGIESIQPSAVSSQKVLRNGMLLIERNGKTYNAQGAEVR